jgi:hypothetical protein
MDAAPISVKKVRYLSSVSSRFLIGLLQLANFTQPQGWTVQIFGRGVCTKHKTHRATIERPQLDIRGSDSRIRFGNEQFFFFLWLV